MGCMGVLLGNVTTDVEEKHGGTLEAYGREIHTAAL